MKKIIVFVISIITIFLFAFSVNATNVGDVIGTVYNTDIVVYINNYAIPSYAANGTSVVVTEDLINFGFDVIWDETTKSLNISRNTTTKPKEINVVKSNKPNSKFSDLLYTDIKVYANKILIPSYAINGYTMIPVESLTMFGDCNWLNEERALKLWIDGLHIREQMQFVNFCSEPHYDINYYNLNKDGYMPTLKDVANEYGISVEELKEAYQLPTDMPDDTMYCIATRYAPAKLYAELHYRISFETILETFNLLNDPRINENMYYGDFEKILKTLP